MRRNTTVKKNSSLGQKYVAPFICSCSVLLLLFEVNFWVRPVSLLEIRAYLTWVSGNPAVN